MVGSLNIAFLDLIQGKNLNKASDPPQLLPPGYGSDGGDLEGAEGDLRPSKGT